MSIADFFAKEGEAAFRQIESETLEELLQEGDDVVISTGGGVVVTERNRQLLVKNRKHNVWLHASFDVVYDRIQKDTKNQRPLFLNHSKEDFKAIYDGRMALYQDLADLVVTVDNRTPEEVQYCKTVDPEMIYASSYNSGSGVGYSYSKSFSFGLDIKF